MKRVLRDPECLLNESNVIRDLIYGWGNESWSALDDYLSACVKYATESDGPILECGSGLTTIVAGLIAQRTGNTVWSLEHDKKWGQMAKRWLNKYQIESVNLHVNPLRDYGDFCWYDPPLNLMPDRFALVICDGPPRKTPGGRYGLLPIMNQRLGTGSVILLDDVARESEQNVVFHWKQDVDMSYEAFGFEKPYFIIKIR